jgi:hypothetical protein
VLAPEWALVLSSPQCGGDMGGGMTRTRLYWFEQEVFIMLLSSTSGVLFWGLFAAVQYEGIRISVTYGVWACY